MINQHFDLRRDRSLLMGLVLDLDGTLLRDDHTVSPVVVSELRSAGQRGVFVSLVSARPARSVLNIAHDARLPGPFAALNGALIVDAAGQMLFRQAIEQEAALSVLRLCEQQPGLSWNAYCGLAWFVGRRDTAVASEARIVGFEPDGERAALTLPQAEKILVLGEDEQLDRLRREIAALHLPVLTAMSKPGYLEVTAPGVSKYSAMCTLAALRGLSPANMAAVGDGENDIEMVSGAGYGVAMGNSCDALKAVAQRVIGTNQSEAVALLVRELFLQT